MPLDGSRCVRRAAPLMGTIVVIDVVDRAGDSAESADMAAALDRAFGWFRDVEARCSRFDPASELRQLTTRIGVAIEVSPILFEAVRFAVHVAERTDGAFDPTMGLVLEAAGFDRHYRTGRPAATPVTGARGSFRDVVLDAATLTIALAQPLLLDLGAVAKGLAVDLAAKELRALGGFAIDAGGDLYLGGTGTDGLPWTVGIRDPRRPDRVIDTVHVSNLAVCTSGDYERRTPDGRSHHVLDGRTRDTATAAASATVVAESAMVADALATAAFVLGPDRGLALLEDEEVQGLVIDAQLTSHATGGFAGHRSPDARV